jgi:Ca2+-transporting ATPase
MRCLGFAFHDAPEQGCVTPEQLTTDMTWLGFVAIEDPVREEVPNAIRACRAAGINVMVVTGDNDRTAREIARQIHLWDGQEDEGACLLGREFRELPDEQAREAVGKLKVLARADPEDKRRLVQLLQGRGEVVAVTGDGFNDVEALHQAQVGLAMGIRGSDSAKKVADIVIKDDSFTSVATGVMWGRSLYQNIQRFILFQLTINVAACGIALLGPFIGVKLPLTVTQMLWVNLIMDTFAALALATEPPHKEVMQRPPRDPEAFIITKAMAQNVFTVGLIFLAFLVAFLVVLKPDAETAQGRHDLSLFFSIFVMLQFWNLFNARSLGLQQSALRGLLANRGFVVIAASIFIGQILFVQFGGEVFRTAPLTLQEWAIVIGGTSVVLWIGELWRLVQRLGKPAAA